MLAWQLSQGKRAIGTRVDRAQLRLTRTADSSLAEATALEPTNVRYLVDFATYRSQGSPFVRAGATRFIKRAFDAARAQGDSLAVAQMADALGMLSFKTYQTMFGRRQFLNNGPAASLLEIVGQQSGTGSFRQSSDALGGSTSASADLVRQAIESRSSLVGGNPPPLAGVPGRTAIVEGSRELIGWLPVATNKFGNPPQVVLTNPLGAGQNQRFYRAYYVDDALTALDTKTWIDSHLDHRMLLRKDDPLVPPLQDMKELTKHTLFWRTICCLMPRLRKKHCILRSRKSWERHPGLPR